MPSRGQESNRDRVDPHSRHTCRNARHETSSLGGHDVDVEKESSAEEFQAGEDDGGVNEQDLAATRGADKRELRDVNLRHDELLPSPCGISAFPSPITQHWAISLSLLALSPRMNCAGRGST